MAATSFYFSPWLCANVGWHNVISRAENCLGA